MKDKIILPLINLIPFPIVRQIGSCKLIIVYYHVVSDEDVPHVSHLYKYKSISQFTADLEFLLEYYTPRGLLDVIKMIRSDHLDSNSLLITFDDGFREIYDVIAPILLSKGIPATFFLSGAFIDNQDLCYEQKASLLIEKLKNGTSPIAEKMVAEILKKMGLSNYSQLPDGILQIEYSQRKILDTIGDVLQIDFNQYLYEKRPYLTSAQVMELIGNGFTIGAHSVDHPYYSELSLEDQLTQTLASVQQIRDKFNLDYGAFAFPHNDTGVTQDFFKRINESRLVDITFGTGGMLDGRLNSHRQRISLENPLLSAKEILSWQYLRRVYRNSKGKKEIAVS